MPSHELGSSAWLGALHTLLREQLSRDPRDTPITICEVYTNAPRHLVAGTNRAISWHCRIEGTSVEFGKGEIDQPDFKAVIDYDFARTLTKWIHQEDSEQRLSEIRNDAVAQGKLTVQGDRSAVSFLQKLHNEIAKLTT